MSDFIRVYIGLMGSGKTTYAVNDIKGCERSLVYASGAPSILRENYPRYIYDTPDFTVSLKRYLADYPHLRIEKRGEQSIFEELKTLHGYRILLDDFPALTTTGEDYRTAQAFFRTVRYNGNQVVVTAHRANGDLPPLLRQVATSIYYVGPSHRGERELRTLYELVNYPITDRDFFQSIISTPKYKTFVIRRPE